MEASFNQTYPKLPVTYHAVIYQLFIPGFKDTERQFLARKQDEIQREDGEDPLLAQLACTAGIREYMECEISESVLIENKAQ